MDLQAENRLDDALAQAKLAAQQDPLAAEPIGLVGLTLYYARRYDEAIAEYLKEIQMEPNSVPHHLSLGRAYAATGQYDLAISELESAVTISGQAPFIIAELARTRTILLELELAVAPPRRCCRSLAPG